MWSYHGGASHAAEHEDAVRGHTGSHGAAGRVVLTVVLLNMIVLGCVRTVDGPGDGGVDRDVKYWLRCSGETIINIYIGIFD